MNAYSGCMPGLGSLSRMSDAETRSISAENRTGEKGKGGMALDGTNLKKSGGLGQGWKISPSILIEPGETAVIADIEGPGAIQHIWMTSRLQNWGKMVFRAYWDNEREPSIETPYSSFFCNGWGVRCNVNSLPISVNPAGGFNSYWVMPFRKQATITIENRNDEPIILYYQITYTLTEIDEQDAYLHAQYHRSNPLPYKQVHTLVDHIKGQGQYVGTYIAWGVNNNGWWGEGEIKFYMDGDQEFPTICGTGTEDYFGGAWNFEHPKGEYGTYSTPFLGMPQVIKPDGLYRSQQRFGMYRWHIMDPIRFKKDLKVTIQALGWRGNYETYLPLQDDIASVAYWYQSEPHGAFPSIPDREFIEVN